MGTDTRDLGAGDSLFTPRGVVHGFSNPHADAAVALIANSPDIGCDYFREISAVLNVGGPPDRAATMAVMQRHGLGAAPLE